MGGVKCHFSESKLFIILTKYISPERSDSQNAIFGGLFVIRVIFRNLDICDRKMHQTKLNGVWMAPGGCLWYDALNKISQESQFFSYQLHIWNITYLDIRL